MKEKSKAKPYDPKKQVWVPNGKCSPKLFTQQSWHLFSLSLANKEEGGYFEGICDEEIKYDTFSAGKKLTVNVKARTNKKISQGKKLTVNISGREQGVQGRDRLSGQPPQGKWTSKIFKTGMLTGPKQILIFSFAVW